MLRQSPEQCRERNEYVQQQCRVLAQVLVQLIPDHQDIGLCLDTLMEIFKEAADLAHQIRLSPQPYQFEIDFRHSDFNRDRVLFETERATYKIINAANGQALRDSEILEAGSNGRVGKKLCVIHPALVRKSEKDHEDVVLTKATILASLDKPIGRPQKIEEKPRVEVKIEGREYGSSPLRKWIGGFWQR